MKIIVVFCTTKSDYVIDVLVRATIDIQETLAYVQDNGMEFLVIRCVHPHWHPRSSIYRSVSPDVIPFMILQRQKKEKITVWKLLFWRPYITGMKWPKGHTIYRDNPSISSIFDEKKWKIFRIFIGSKYRPAWVELK